MGKQSSKVNSSGLMSPKKSTAEIAIQTEIVPDPKSRKTVKVFDKDGQQVNLLDDFFGDTDICFVDWKESIVFKRAMYNEAVKRGEPIESEFDISDEDERVLMTAT